MCVNSVRPELTFCIPLHVHVIILITTYWWDTKTAKINSRPRLLLKLIIYITYCTFFQVPWTARLSGPISSAWSTWLLCQRFVCNTSLWGYPNPIYRLMKRATSKNISITHVEKVLKYQLFGLVIMCVNLHIHPQTQKWISFDNKCCGSQITVCRQYLLSPETPE